MSKITLTHVGSLIDATTAANTINADLDIIQTAMDNTVSRDGTTPNTMTASLDMNSNQIINLPAPTTSNSPARLIDVVTNPTITIPTTGTSGHTVPFLDGTNTWSGANTFSAPGLTSPTLTTPLIHSATLDTATTVNGPATFTGNVTATAGTTALGTTSATATTITGNITSTGGTNSFSGTTTLSGQVLQPNRPSFFVHNNGVTFTYTPPNPNKYMLFRPSTARFNTGSPWSLSTYRFTPPSGTNLVYLDAAIWITSASTAAGSFVAKWIKNFTYDGSFLQVTGTDVFAGVGGSTSNIPGTFICRSSGFDQPAASDYYGLFVFIDATPLGTTAVQVDGNSAHTYISGAVVS